MEIIYGNNMRFGKKFSWVMAVAFVVLTISHVIESTALNNFTTDSSSYGFILSWYTIAGKISSGADSSIIVSPSLFVLAFILLKKRFEIFSIIFFTIGLLFENNLFYNLNHHNQVASVNLGFIETSFLYWNGSKIELIKSVSPFPFYILALILNFELLSVRPSQRSIKSP